jgi:catalase (peroxidase I)
MVDHQEWEGAPLVAELLGSELLAAQIFVKDFIAAWNNIMNRYPRHKA